MKEKMTELVFILDRSGSMGGLESDTIGGFNSMLKQQSAQEGHANVTTVLFDDRTEVLHDRIPITRVKPLTEREYYVRGCTALLDAIGSAIDHMGTIQKNLGEEVRADKVIFVITTDGLENASRKYGYREIKRMIDRQKEKYHWEFIFLGANIDAVAEAKKMGIDEDRAVTYQNDSDGIALNYRVVSDTICKMRVAKPTCDFIGAEWKQEIERDVKSRKSDKGGHLR